MMFKVLSSDFLKIRGTGIWFLIVIGPVGLIAMQALNFGLRYDYLTQQYAGHLWEGLLENIAMFVPISLILGITLVSSLLANVEHRTHAWKQLLALPLSRGTVMAAKFAVCVIMLALSCSLLALGTIALGLSLRFGFGFPLVDIIRLSFLPFFAAFPLLAFILWLCMTIKNQAIPVTIGIITALVSVFSMQLSEWFPVNWPLLGYVGPRQELFVGAGLLVGALILLVGSIHFTKRDVN